MLKRFLIISVAAAVFGTISAFFWAQYQADNMNDAAAQTINTEAPNVKAVTKDGTVVELASIKGKPVFLNFWATWCAPCMEEMPHINNVYAQYRDKVEFMVVSIDDSKADYEKYVSSQTSELPLLFGDKAQILEDFKLQGIPATYFIDKYGTITKSHIGGMTENQLKTFLEVNLMQAQPKQ